MVARIVPEIGSQDSRQLCDLYDAATHLTKLDLATERGISLDTLKHYRSACRAAFVKRDYKLPPDSSWEEHIDIFKRMDKLVAFHQKTPTEITIVIDTKLPIGVVITADWQLGQFGVDYDSFSRDCNIWETEPGLHIMVGGDGYQNIIEESKIGSAHSQMPISPQKGLYVLTLKKLQQKILCIGTGNHNYWSALKTGEDWDNEIARKLKLVYTKHFAVINLKVGSMLYSILRIHKAKFESSFNLTHAAKQNQRIHFPDARIVVIEHKHTGAMEQYRYNERECIAARPGTYAVYDDFAMREGFFGAHVCNPTVVLYPNEDRLVGFKDMDDALIYLRAARS